VTTRRSRVETSGGGSCERRVAQPPVWERFTDSDDGVDLREAVGSLAAAAKQVGTTGTAEQATRAAEIITAARKSLYQLLAE
jgi:hypothetical protein